MNIQTRYIFILIITFSTMYAKAYSNAELHAIRYQNQINTTLSQMGSRKKFTLSTSEHTTDNRNISTFIVNDNIALSTTSDETKLLSVIYIAKTDGTPKSAIDLLFSAVSSVAALINPYMVAKERHQILDALGLGKDMPVINTNQSFKYDIKDYHISSSFIKNMGYMITIDREAKKKKTNTNKIPSIYTNTFINPIGYIETENTRKNVINYIKKHTKEQYKQINMDDPLTLRMMEQENLTAFKRLVHAGDKQLLQKTINQYCSINMCDYTTIKMMYEQQFKAKKKSLKW